MPLSQIKFVLRDGEICPHCYRVKSVNPMGELSYYNDSTTLGYLCDACSYDWKQVRFTRTGAAADLQLIGYADLHE